LALHRSGGTLPYTLAWCKPDCQRLQFRIDQRDGHLDYTLIGALQVDSEANLANWWILRGKLVPGMGGAMDLVTGVKNVIVGSSHISKKGAAKLVNKCDLLLTGVGVVSMEVTEYYVMRFPEKKMTLFELPPGVSIEDLREVTGLKFAISESLCQKQETPWLLPTRSGQR